MHRIAALQALATAAAAVLTLPVVWAGGASANALGGVVAGTTAVPARRAFVCGTPAYTHPKELAGPGDHEFRLTLELGGVKATFTAVAVAGEAGAGFSTVRHAGLTVTASGRLVHKAALVPPFGFSTVQGATTLMSLAGGVKGSAGGVKGSTVCVARFGGTSPETAVLVGTYSGGAHCCTWVYAYVAAPAQARSAKPLWQDIGNPGVRLRDYAGTTLLVTADNSFAYTFAPYAGSGMPVRTLELRGGKFVGTTREHLKLVAADARFWWEQYSRIVAHNRAEMGDGLGVFAPWVADECLLGKAETTWATARHLQEQGYFSPGLPGWPKGAAYVKALRSFLVKGGYCPA